MGHVHVRDVQVIRQGLPCHAGIPVVGQDERIANAFCLHIAADVSDPLRDVLAQRLFLNECVPATGKP